MLFAYRKFNQVDNSQNEKTSQMLERLSQWLGLESSLELAEKLGVAPSTLSGWKARGTIPIKYFLEFAEREDINLNWLLLGVGPQSRRVEAEQTEKLTPRGLEAAVMAQGKRAQEQLRLGQIASMAQLGKLGGVWKTLSMIPTEDRGEISHIELREALGGDVQEEELIAQLSYLKESGQIFETKPSIYSQFIGSSIHSKSNFEENEHTLEALRVLSVDLPPALKAGNGKLLTIKGHLRREMGLPLINTLASNLKAETRRVMQAPGDGAFIDIIFGVVLKDT